MAAVQFKNKVLILSVVAGVLAVAYALGLVFSPTNVQRRRSEVPVFAALKSDAVKKIEVSGAEGAVQLVRGDKGWSVLLGGSPYPASEERVKSFFDSLTGLQRTRVVSTSPDSWKSFDVAEEARTRIRLLDASDKPLVNLLVGRAEEAERGSFVRLEGTNEVLLTNKSLGFYLEAQPNYWSYLKFFGDELSGDKVMRISVRADLAFADGSSRRLAYTLIQKEAAGRKWQVVEPAADRAMALDNKEVDRMATTLAGFEGSEFVPGSVDSGLGSPAAEILFSTVDNKDYRILIGKRSGQDQYYAKVDGGSYVYLAPEWRVKMATQPLEDLREKTK
jgi:hypothetical protein